MDSNKRQSKKTIMWLIDEEQMEGKRILHAQEELCLSRGKTRHN